MRSGKISWKWVPMILSLVFIASFVLFDASGLVELDDWAGRAESYGSMAGLIIFVLLVSDVITPVPSSVLMALAGSVYGLGWGFLIGFAGSMGASFVGFFIMRRLRKPVGDRLIGEEELDKMNAWFDRWGEIGIVISRMTPIAAETMSFLAGLSKMAPRKFFTLASFGVLPISACYAYAGSVSRNSIEGFVFLTVGFVIPVVTWKIFKRFSQEKTFFQPLQ